MALPDPMTPPECNLRGMPFMALDIVRLFDSDLYALSTGDEFKAAVTLWGKAFLQVPAGSLPDDDRILAHLSNAGSNWQEVKSIALRGWVKCSDGRLYHHVVAEKATLAWDGRVSQRARTEAARAAKAAKKPKPRDDGTTDPVTAPSTDSVTAHATETVTGSKGEGEGQLRKREPNGSLLSDRPAPIERVPAVVTPPLDLSPDPPPAAKPRKRRSADAEPEGFAEFYAAYPRREKRRDAARAFMGAVSTAGGLDALMAGLKRFRFSADPQFIPHPASWLNSRRWQDEPIPSTSPGAAPRRTFDARYFGQKPEVVAALPQPRVGSEEHHAWSRAHEGFVTSHPDANPG